MTIPVGPRSPAISVVMPAHNAEPYLACAVRSILTQSFTDFELILLDDASRDGTWAVAEALARQDARIRAIRNPTNLKIAATLNRGIELARGRYVVRMDADDWSYPNRLQKQFEFMEDHPEVVVSGGTIEVCDGDLAPVNRREYPRTDAEIRQKMFFFSPFCHPAIICRTDALRKAGGYNPSLEVAQDYELYFRIGRLGELANLGDCIHKLRTHRASSSISRGAMQERNTLYIRTKAVIEYGYRMSTAAKVYLALQYLSSFVVPFRLKFWLFNLLRRSA